MQLKKNFCSVAVVLALCCLQANAQQVKYSVSNAHAHNDYEHPVPFYTAYNAGFGSIEADIILQDGQLYVAHTAFGVKPSRTLQSLYLEPLQKEIQKNNGHVYADSSKQLILLIDFKTGANETLEVLLPVLQQYKTLTDCRGLKLVITGNQPPVSSLATYPSFLHFDGDVNKTYTLEALSKVALFSHNFRKFSSWKGDGALADSDREKIAAAISKAHALNKPIRFWAAPDSETAWRQLMELSVDYINTDKIEEISAYLKKGFNSQLHN